MENLTGISRADEFIQEELLLAGIDTMECRLSDGEVPYSIFGKFGSWSFSRNWNYLVAVAETGKGLSLDVATELYEKKYPILGERQPKTYGEVIRAGGDCACRSPDMWVKHYDFQGIELILDPEWKQEADFRSIIEKILSLKQGFEKLRFVQSLDWIIEKSVVDTYHIDSQMGLNEFVRTIK